jgi:heterodisulfide reductase subunit D
LVRLLSGGRRKEASVKRLQEILRETQLYNCLSCGRCTGSCPVSAVHPGFSPRLIVERIFSGEIDEIVSSGELYRCWTCGLCSEKCHLDVDFPAFIRMLRGIALSRGISPEYPHHGVVQTFQAMMTDERLSPSRKPPDLPVGSWNEDAEEILYFRGCGHLFDSMLEEAGRPLSKVEESVTRLLGAMNFKPVFLSGEKCCGHDLLWSGDERGFMSLAAQNLEMLRSAGIRKIVTSCPECCHTIKEEYHARFPGEKLEVCHWVELFEERGSSLSLAIEGAELVATYLDPCKMARYLNIVDEPRKILRSIGGLRFNELDRKGRKAACCGVGAWVSCSGASKNHQTSLLREAKNKAEILVTSCPRCLLHLSCAAREEKGTQALRIMDLAELAASSLVKKRDT